MKPAISVHNISKQFSFWEDRPSDLKRLLIRLLKGQFKLGGARRTFSVLQDVSFDIMPGEFVGIMGRNGAGKSTMLKLISGIYQPTHGTIDVAGKIAPLLELGAGFSSELSGYDNIFLNAAILGYGRAQTLQSIQAIIDFAELGEMIYLPVKKYSSGMMIRLGFAIAVHLDAPILLFDEVLAVGDAGFQEKCLNKIQSLHARGKTIVLVTHDADAVKRNCTRCILIENHKKVFDGNATLGAMRYLQGFGAIPQVMESISVENRNSTMTPQLSPS